MTSQEPLFSLDDMSETEKTVIIAMRGMSEDQRRVIIQFILQTAIYPDPDAARTFVAFRDNPRLDTLMLVGSQLGDEALDQLLFVAEDLHDQDRPESPQN